MRIIKKFIVTVIVVFFIGGCVAGGRLLWEGYRMYQEVIAGEPLTDKVEEIRSKPHYTTLDQLPDTYKNAVVAVEDKRFYKHGGIDLISTFRAVFINLKEKKFLRKVAELFVAFQLEKNYSKEEILELYVNTIYFGSGYYCVYDAAQGYFEKEPGEMSDYESTLLAGIPNAPSVYALTNRPELAAQRQRTVVECMVEQKVLTQEEAEHILGEGEQTIQDNE